MQSFYTSVAEKDQYLVQEYVVELSLDLQIDLVENKPILFDIIAFHNRKLDLLSLMIFYESDRKKKMTYQVAIAALKEETMAALEA